jgi:hypothetical protein
VIYGKPRRQRALSDSRGTGRALPSDAAGVIVMETLAGDDRITGEAVSFAEQSITSRPPLPELRRRRDLLLLAGGAVAFLALAASSLAALAQTAPDAAPLKIGTIGAGREGGALGTLFAKVGHPVMFSSRHPTELKDLARPVVNG